MSTLDEQRLMTKIVKSYDEHGLNQTEIAAQLGNSQVTVLLAMIAAVHSIPARKGVSVVQILGGMGNPSTEMHAARVTSRLANLVNGTAVFLPTPGIVGPVLITDRRTAERLASEDESSPEIEGTPHTHEWKGKL